LSQLGHPIAAEHILQTTRPAIGIESTDIGWHALQAIIQRFPEGPATMAYISNLSLHVRCTAEQSPMAEQLNKCKAVLHLESASGSPAEACHACREAVLAGDEGQEPGAR